MGGGKYIIPESAEFPLIPVMLLVCLLDFVLYSLTLCGLYLSLSIIKDFLCKTLITKVVSFFFLFLNFIPAMFCFYFLHGSKGVKGDIPKAEVVNGKGRVNNH